MAAKAVRQINEIIGGNGGNWAYFARNKAVIGEFIAAHKLTPARVVGQVGAMEAGAHAVRAAAPAAIIDLGIRGGIRAPHLHFDDKIYLLDETQWAALSKTIIADCKTKLSRVKTVSFEEGMLIGSLTETL